MEKGLTDAQYEALVEFKKNVAEILTPYHTDAILIKWLRSKNFNPRKAETYFREMWAFQELYEFELNHDDYVKPEFAEKYEYTTMLGFAKDGTIVRYNPVGRGDHLGFLMSMNAFEIGFYATHIMVEDINTQRKENKRRGEEINEITYIFDMDGFSIQDLLHKAVLELAFELGVMVQDYYPEIWGNIFFINVPAYFDIPYNMFRPILRHTVIRKLHILSREATPTVLLKYIDADVLPAFLGGNRVDSKGDPRCAEFIKFGGRVSREYHLCNRGLPVLMPTDPGVNVRWVGPRGVYNHIVKVTKPDSTISIEFRTESGSIHLRILYRKLEPDTEKQDIPTIDEYLDERDEKTNVKLISPGMWIQSHLIPSTKGKCKAPWPGLYILRFSNSHSIFGSRRLIYKIELNEPEYSIL